jgi:hypothetical protein
VPGSAQKDKDLYTLVGRYEAFSLQVLQELRDINVRLEEGDKNFEVFNLRCQTHSSKLSDHEKRLKTIEKTGIPKRTKMQLDGTTLLTFINTVLTILSRLWPF